MHWLKRGLWKAGIAIVGMLLLVVLMVWVPVSAVGVHEGALGLASPGTVTVQATPTEDATVTALNREKLKGDVAQQQHTLGNWLWSNAAAVLSGFLSTLVVVVGLLIGFRQWSVNRDDTRSKESKDRQDAQSKELKAQAEERFKTAVTALGGEKESVQIGGAILLRSFLNKDDKEIYERYYTQIFDLAVAYLRLPRTPNPPENPVNPVPLTTLSQALSVVFKDAFPLARDSFTKSYSKRSLGKDMEYLGSPPKWDPRSLNSSGIHLDDANLAEAVLKDIWMQGAFLRRANLRSAQLPKANLRETDLSEAKLSDANLCEAQLRGVILSKARLHRASLDDVKFKRANLSEADFEDAKLQRANFEDAKLQQAIFWRADLTGANFERANLSQANFREATLSNTNLNDALSLKDTDLRQVKGLTKEQLETCKAKGAIIDEDSPISSS